MVGACGNKNKGATEKIDDAVQVSKVINTKNLTAKSFEPMLEVKKRKVSKADSEDALREMGLDEAKNSPFNWDSKSEKGGKHIYKNLSATGKDGEDITINSLEITGAHMAEDEPSFDRLDMRGINVSSKDGTAKIARLSLARPSPKLGSAIMSGCLLYTSPSPRDATLSRMPSSA